MTLDATSPIDCFDVVIIGGGVAGGSLATALAYADGGVRVLLVEQSQHSSAINRGDFIHPPHIELLDRWGVLNEMLRMGAVPVTHNEFYSNSGKLLLRHDFSFFDSKYPYGIALEHPDIEESIIKVASRHPMNTVWRNTRYIGISDQNGNTLVHLIRDNNIFTVQANWVIAADGRNSKLRKDAGIESILRPYDYDILMTRIPNIPCKRNTSLQFTGKYGYLGLFVSNGAYTRVAVPLKAGTASSFIQTQERLKNNEVKRRAALLEDTHLMWEHHHVYKLFEHHAAVYNKGRVVLLGDAAHSFTPMLGMGMNLAFEEAATLSTILSRRSHVLTAASLKETYEGRHRKRNQRILEQSRRQGSFLVASGKMSRTTMRAGFVLASRFSPLERAMFRSIFGSIPSDI